MLLATSRPASAQDDTLGGWRLPNLIDAVASFGAVGLDGALYVYGGHVGRVHAHSLENISPGFRRLVLDAGATWEELARGPRLQGAVLVSDGTAVYRVGGFSAANATVAEPAVLHSSRSVARYSAAADRWEALPDLPVGRSSHDAVVAGGVLYVVGGWDMRGPGNDSAWADTVLALDLNGGSAWREIPAPFQRRALAAGTRDGRIYALGGLSRATGPVSTVDVLDPETGAWSKGPDLPRSSMLGFGAAAASDEGRIIVSQADGEVYRLAADGAAWEPVATLGQPRYMHRLIPVGTHLLAVGGAGREGHLATIEVVDVGASDREPAGRTGATRWAGFRGGRDTNVSRAARLPLTWSDDTVAWRTTTPGFGQSSPVIWDDTVFLTSLEGAMKETIHVTALDLEDGSERWRRRFDAAETFEWNDYVSKGAPTPAVDCERLYAFFDSGDLMALTHDGDTVWHRDLSTEMIRASYARNEGVEVLQGAADDPPLAEETPLGSIAPNEGVVGLRYVQPSGRWGGELSLRLVEAYQQGNDEQFAPDAYQIVDLVSFVSLTEALKFRLGLLNLTDAKYFEWWNVRGRQTDDPVIDRYSSPGLSVITSLAYDW